MCHDAKGILGVPEQLRNDRRAEEKRQKSQACYLVKKDVKQYLNLGVSRKLGMALVRLEIGAPIDEGEKLDTLPKTKRRLGTPREAEHSCARRICTWRLRFGQDVRPRRGHEGRIVEEEVGGEGPHAFAICVCLHRDRFGGLRAGSKCGGGRGWGALSPRRSAFAWLRRQLGRKAPPTSTSKLAPWSVEVVCHGLALASSLPYR